MTKHAGAAGLAGLGIAGEYAGLPLDDAHADLHLTAEEFADVGAEIVRALELAEMPLCDVIGAPVRQVCDPGPPPRCRFEVTTPAA